MAENDFSDIEHCVYMIDLVFREFLGSSKIKDKRFAMDALTSAFLDILRHEGYPLSRESLERKLAYHH